MPEPIVNEFTTYKFATQEEELLSRVFTDIQLAGLRTQLATYARDRAQLTIAYEYPDAERAYMLAQQKLLGNIEAIQFLLALHDSALEALQELANNRSSNQ